MSEFDSERLTRGGDFARGFWRSFRAISSSSVQLTASAEAALPPTPLIASLGTTSGSRFFHKLELLSKAAITLKVKNLRTQRGFWLANHTPGCDWDTWQQLLYRDSIREEQDAESSQTQTARIDPRGILQRRAQSIWRE